MTENTYETLLNCAEVIVKNPPFQASVTGFLIRVSSSLRDNIITPEQKDKLLKISKINYL